MLARMLEISKGSVIGLRIFRSAAKEFPPKEAVNFFTSNVILSKLSPPAKTEPASTKILLIEPGRSGYFTEPLSIFNLKSHPGRLVSSIFPLTIPPISRFPLEIIPSYPVW